MRRSLVILSLIAQCAYATTYYVRTTGNDGNAGTSSGTAFLTIGKAQNVAVPGDIINIGNGTFSGSSNVIGGVNWVTYTITAPDTAMFTSGAYALFNGIHGVTIDGGTHYGFRFRNCTARSIKITRQSYRITVKGCIVSVTDKSIGSNEPIYVANDSTGAYYVDQTGTVHGIVFERIRALGEGNAPDSVGATPGSPLGPGTSAQGSRDMLIVGDVDTMSIKDCFFTNVNHYAITLKTLVDRVYMKRDTAYWNHGGFSGNGPVGQVVMEDCFTMGGAYNTQGHGTLGQFGFTNSIFRFNIFCQDTVTRGLTLNVGVSASTIDPYDDIIPRCQQWYNNTFSWARITPRWGNAYPAPDSFSAVFGFVEGGDSPSDINRMNQNYALNNIIYSGSRQVPILMRNEEVENISTSDSNYWDGNIAYNYATNPIQSWYYETLNLRRDTANVDLVYGEVTNTNIVRSFTTLHTMYPRSWGASNQYAQPDFVDATNHKFEPTSTSVVVNASVPLTLVNDAGGGGKTMVVDNARPFTDGWGGWFPGDSIKIGSQNAVGVTGVNYLTNTITLSSSRSWGDNDEVFLRRGGVEANDVGAKQYGSSAPTSLEISTSSSLPGGTKSFSYSTSIAAANGTAPYSFALAPYSGSLPSGLSLSSAGVISGTPTGIGTSAFTVQVTDAVSATATKAFTLTIADYTSTPPIQKLWACDGQEIIRWDTRDCPARDRDSNLVWNETAGSINIFALKNDVASFQVVLEAGATSVDSVNVDLRFLQQAGVADIKNTAANCTTFVGRDIEGFLESYVHLTETSNERAATIFWHNSYPTPTDKYIGWVPQQLVPLEAPRGTFLRGSDTLQGGAGGPTGPGFRIYANKNAVVWYDVRVDKSKPSGLYTGELLVYRKSRGDTLFRVPVNLTVYNHRLSDTSHLPTMMHLHDIDVASRGGVSLYTPYYWSWLQRADFFYRRHRIDMILTKESVDSLNAHRKGVYSGTSYTPANGYEGQGQGRGNGLYIVALWNVNNIDYPTTGYRINQVGPYEDTQSGWRNLSDAFEQFFLTNAPHVLRAVEQIDEPKNHDEDGGVQRSAIHSRAAWIRTGTGVGRNIHTFIPNGWLDPWTVEGVPAYGWVSDISMWAQNPFSVSWGLGYNTANYNPRSTAPGGKADEYTVEEVVELGAANPTPTTISTYNGSPGYTPVVGSLDVPLTEPLLFSVLAMKYNLPWLWYWSGTYWSQTGDVNANPWVETNYAMNQSDDGNLVYYGRDKMYPADDRGVNTFIASLRLKAVRDGLRMAEMMYDCRRYGVYDTTWTRTMGVFAGFNDYRFSQFQHDSPPPWAQTGYLVEGVRKKMALALDAGTEEPPAENPVGWILLRR